MTNEEKAKSLFQKYKDATMLGEPLSQGSVAFQSSLEMAEWKDRQFQEERKQWIEKAVDLIEDNIDTYLFINMDWMEAQIDSKEFIKFFKQVMEK